MAKVTTEDCRYVAGGRFKLVSVAAFRAKMLNKGAPAFVKTDNLRGTVIALREVAQLMLDCNKIEEEIVKAYQSHNMHHKLAEKNLQQEAAYLSKTGAIKGRQYAERKQMIDADVYDLFMDVLGGSDSNAINISTTAKSKAEINESMAVSDNQSGKLSIEQESQRNISKRGKRNATDAGGKKRKNPSTNNLDAVFSDKSNLYENI